MRSTTRAVLASGAALLASSANANLLVDGSF